MFIWRMEMEWRVVYVFIYGWNISQIKFSVDLLTCLEDRWRSICRVWDCRLGTAAVTSALTIDWSFLVFSNNKRKQSISVDFRHEADHRTETSDKMAAGLCNSSDHKEEREQSVSVRETVCWQPAQTRGKLSGEERRWASIQHRNEAHTYSKTQRLILFMGAVH